MATNTSTTVDFEQIMYKGKTYLVDYIVDDGCTYRLAYDYASFDETDKLNILGVWNKHIKRMIFSDNIVQKRVYKGKTYLVDKDMDATTSIRFAYDYDVFTTTGMLHKCGEWDEFLNEIEGVVSDGKRKRTQYEVLPPNFRDTTNQLQIMIKFISQDILATTTELSIVKADKAEQFETIIEIKAKLKREQQRMKALQAKEKDINKKLASYRLDYSYFHTKQYKYLARFNPHKIATFK